MFTPCGFTPMAGGGLDSTHLFLGWELAHIQYVGVTFDDAKNEAVTRHCWERRDCNCEERTNGWICLA